MRTSCAACAEVAVSLARREHASYIVFKEFPAGDCPKMDFLQELGYRRFSYPPMNPFDRRFADFDAYVDALRSRYRRCVRKSLDKSRAADLRYERLTDTGRDTPPVQPRLCIGFTRRSPFHRHIGSSSFRSRSSTAWRGTNPAWSASHSFTLAIVSPRSTGTSSTRGLSLSLRWVGLRLEPEPGPLLQPDVCRDGPGLSRRRRDAGSRPDGG